MNNKTIISELTVALIISMAISMAIGAFLHGTQDYFPWYTACGVIGYMSSKFRIWKRDSGE